MPAMEAYDGIENTRDYVINYKTFMELQTHSDALLCKVFPIILTEVALTWFNNVETKSIKTFMDLANTFIGRFIASLPTQLPRDSKAKKGQGPSRICSSI